MADGISFDTYDVATDDAGASGHVQLFKLAYSANGSASLVTADGSGLEVQLGTSLPVGSNTIGDVTVSSLPSIALAANSGVDIGDVDITSVTPGTGVTSLGKATGSVASTTHVGVASLAARVDILGELIENQFDYTHMRVDDYGRLWTRGGDIIDLTTYDAQAVAIVDGDGDQVTFSSPTVLSVVPTLDTSAYAVGDSMDTTILTFANAAATSAGSGHIVRMTVIDDDDQGEDMKIHFFEASVTPATENTAHSLSDDDADEYIGTISTSDGTWQDHANNQTCTVTPSPPLAYKLDSGTSLYGVLVSEGTGTYTASGVQIKLQVLRD